MINLKLRPYSSDKWINCPAPAQLEQGYPDKGTFYCCQPRISKSASSNLFGYVDSSGNSQWILTIDELVTHIEEVKKAIAIAKSDNPPYHAGKHCMFCRAKNGCHAKWRGAEYGYPAPAPKSDIHFEDESCNI